MYQIIQHQKTGKLSIEDLPSPRLRGGHVLVRNAVSLVSAGTERISVETAQASLLGKAKSRPDLVRRVLDNVRREGVITTYSKVKNRLDNYKELGYSSAGVVLESAVEGFRPGDRVACAGTAYHAEVVSVPKHLVARVPDEVDLADASFTTLGAIALHGVRQANARVGENVAVIGLGLVGLLTVQILKAAGCRVIGVDISNLNFRLATDLGCDECVPTSGRTAIRIRTFTKGYGTDSVIITASTGSNEPLELALEVARKKSSVVIVGAVGMKVPRLHFYEKELNLTISCSYGPGRYDPDYELKGNDYPIGYVRWTENRNMEAVLNLMKEGRLNVKGMVTHRFPISEALKAYDILTGRSTEKTVAILIDYPVETKAQRPRRFDLRPAPPTRLSQSPVIGFIGAGNFAQSSLLPHLQKQGIELRTVVTSRPVNAKSAAEKFEFTSYATDPEEVMQDKTITAVFVATRHDSHAKFVVDALKQGKHVFVEKPLAIDSAGLLAIRKQYTSSAEGGIHLLVGFNRRFSAPFIDIGEFLSESVEPMTMYYRVNAGRLPAAHWLNDPTQGGRIIGEACHFVDTMSFIAGSLPVRVFAEGPRFSSAELNDRENVTMSFLFSDGSVGTLQYLANGDPGLGKEYFEAHRSGMSVRMENFKHVTFSNGGKQFSKRYDGSKGHEQEIGRAIACFRGIGPEPIPFDSLCATTEGTFAVLESLRQGKPIDF